MNKPESDAQTQQNPADTEETSPIGKVYDGGTWPINKDDFQSYARATDDENGAYFRDEPIAPPMFHTRPLIKLLMTMASDPELALDLLRLVHAEHDMHFHGPLLDGDSLTLTGTLCTVLEKSSGQLVEFDIKGDVDGEVRLEGRTAYFIRAKSPGPKKSTTKTPAPAPPEPDLTVVQESSDDQAIRYALASGDDNPIHVDEATAKAAGLPRTILHGLCTMAFAQRDLIRYLADGEPERLKRLAVRWSRPVFPGDTLKLSVWSNRDGTWTFTQQNADGKSVVVNGRATITPA